MSESVVKKGLRGDVLFFVGGIVVIAGVLWLFARCGLTC